LKKTQNISVWLSIIPDIPVAGTRRKQQHCGAAPAEKKSAINIIRLQLSVSDWSIILIGPGGLLLVVPPHPPYSLLFTSFNFMDEVENVK
jgi:hypothetical protein